MSGQILEIKKKIHGIKNTRKITKAMQLVAASKMRQFQKRAVHARGFVWDLLKVLYSNLSEESQSLYTEKRESGKTLFVLYTSDKGLCGGLNTKLINGLFRSKKWTDLKEEERALITIGKKAQNFANNNKIPVTKHFTGIPEKLSNLDAIKVVDAIFELWQKEGELKEVIFIAPHYKNSFTFYPVVKTFLPFSQEAVKGILAESDEELTDSESLNQFMIYSPDQETVLDRLYEQIIQALFIESFLQLKASEYSSRMIAMQNATDAADKITANLTLVYNKARQQAITQEIAELIGASMAISEE